MSQSSIKPIKESKSLFKNPFLWGAIGGMIILPVLRMLAMARRDAPAPLVQVGPWQLNDADQTLVSQETLNGKIVVFNLYYKDCGDECINSFKMLNEVKERFKGQPGQVEILSLPVANVVQKETSKNTLPVLFHEAYSWTFLEGSTLALQQLILEKMKLQDMWQEKGFAFDKEDADNDVLLLLKRMADGGKLFLLDQNGDLRLAVDTQLSSLAGLVRAGLFLIEKGPDA
jgi:cytochrome oxidase Cu insertion factor (SCO1/SenC/PrrC family)